MILVGKMVISLLLMFLCLVIDVVCLNISSFFIKDLDMYQVLPRPYLGSFDGGTGDKLIKKEWV